MWAPNGSGACSGAQKQSDNVKWSPWEFEVLYNLRRAGADGVHAADYLVKHKTSFDNLTYQPFGTGAAWQRDGTITFPNNNSLPDPNNAYAVGLIAHEAMHLEQGSSVALTAYGELQAWQVGIKVTEGLNDFKSYADMGDKIKGLPLSQDPDNLRTGVIDMLTEQNGPGLVGPRYLTGWLLFFTIPPDPKIFSPGSAVTDP